VWGQCVCGWGNINEIFISIIKKSYICLLVESKNNVEKNDKIFAIHTIIDNEEAKEERNLKSMTPSLITIDPPITLITQNILSKSTTSSSPEIMNQIEFIKTKIGTISIQSSIKGNISFHITTLIRHALWIKVGFFS
jgi:hypothetical protein